MAMKVMGVVMTSSPGPMPSASSDMCIAPVQLITQRQCGTPRYSASISLHPLDIFAGRQNRLGEDLLYHRNLGLAEIVTIERDGTRVGNQEAAPEEGRASVGQSDAENIYPRLSRCQRIRSNRLGDRRRDSESLDGWGPRPNITFGQL